MTVVFVDTSYLIARIRLGLVKGRLVERSPLLQGLEILGIGTISAAIGYALGDLIPRLFA
jgi:VIT1/CCC1 family predicted Fe2+/Mn2+ transporter